MAVPCGHPRLVLTSRRRLERRRYQRHCACVRGAAACLGVAVSKRWAAAQHRARSPYAALAYAVIFRQHGIIASMSRAGDCYGNAVLESFFGTLKAERMAVTSIPSRGGNRRHRRLQPGPSRVGVAGSCKRRPGAGARAARRRFGPRVGNAAGISTTPTQALAPEVPWPDRVRIESPNSGLCRLIRLSVAAEEDHSNPLEPDANRCSPNP
jgi:hypothetical protein